MKDYIVRVRLGSKQSKRYEYRDKLGKVLSQAEYEPYLQGVYIAPAYNPVKINKRRNDKVLAIGTDERGRKQYTYNPHYVQKAQDNKYKKLIMQ